MRCLMPFVLLGLVVVLCLGGYNYLQIGRISSELAEVKAKATRQATVSPDQKAVLAALESAKLHAERARVLIKKGKTRTAQQELDRSVERLSKAASLSKKMATEEGNAIDSAVTTFRKRIESVVGDISKQLDKSKPAGDRQGRGE